MRKGGNQTGIREIYKGTNESKGRREERETNV